MATADVTKLLEGLSLKPAADLAQKQGLTGINSVFFRWPSDTHVA